MTKIKSSNLDNDVVTGLTEDTSPAADDVIIVYDTSANSLKKVQKSNFSLAAPEITSISPTVVDPDGSTTTTLDHTGFVSDKTKGDGYYSQPDGVHTVAYQVNSTMTGSIKMQGSLATTPTEDDWFDISGTSFTTDGTTTIKNISFNFTGNIVWVRAKATVVTGGTIQSVLLNN